MAATALDILSLDSAKRELRVEKTDAFDARIIEEIGAAVDFVERELGRPLIDVHEALPVHPPAAGDELPVELRATDVATVGDVSYWTPAGALRLDPDGTVARADLGRVLIGDNEVVAYPPVGGWPAVLPGSKLRVAVTRAFDVAAHPSVRQAVISALRNFYNGATEIMVRNAVFHLLRPWRRLARGS